MLQQFCAVKAMQSEFEKYLYGAFRRRACSSWADPRLRIRTFAERVLLLSPALARSVPGVATRRA
eukprot:1791355-Prymnesium_polylepis.1